MTIPSSVMVECPVCRIETLHEVLHGKLGGKAQAVFESTVRCKECGQVHPIVLKVEKPIEVPIVVSWLKESKKSSIVVGPEDALSVEDEIMCGDEPVQITSIESHGARVRRAKARNIQTVWARRFDKIRVPFSISQRARSISDHVLAVPDEEFFVGDVLKVGKHEVVIHSIKIEDKSLRTGGARARDIVRVYATVVRRTNT
jgi:uncharacterized Zn finger protein